MLKGRTQIGLNRGAARPLDEQAIAMAASQDRERGFGGAEDLDLAAGSGEEADIALNPKAAREQADRRMIRQALSSPMPRVVQGRMQSRSCGALTALCNWTAMLATTD